MKRKINTRFTEYKSLRQERQPMLKLLDKCVFIDTGSECLMSHCDFLKNKLRVKRNTAVVADMLHGAANMEQLHSKRSMNTSAV